MAIILDLKDFVIDYQIQFPEPQEAEWLNRLEIHEELQLKKLFGDVLFEQFKIDPNATRWNLIKSPFIDSKGRMCRGLKFCILAFVYCDLTKYGGVYTPKQASKIKSEVTTQVDLQSNMMRAYNGGVDDARLIRERIRKENVIFPEYQHESFCHEYLKMQPW